MKSYWWKFLGIAILIYTVVIGMSIPLKPGISSMNSLSMGLDGNHPTSIHSGEQHLFFIEGYNTNFNKTTRAWLIADSTAAIEGEGLRIEAYNRLFATFNLPRSFPGADTVQQASLWVHTDGEGTALLPDAVFVTTDVTKNGNKTEWNANVKDLTEKPGIQFPYRSVLNETIRNTFFHIPLWFSMFILLIISLVYSIKYLRFKRLNDDIIASALVSIAVLFGVLGIVTGSIWAKYTWGTFWTTDVKLNMSTVAMLIYVASLILRSSINDIDRRAELSASYNIFAFLALIPLVFVIPRLTDSLHPGNGGNPALGGEDMENTLRLVFYPAIIGFTLLGLWMSSLLIRYEQVKDKWLSKGDGDKFMQY